MSFSYAAIAGGTRVKKLVVFQRMYRQHATYLRLLASLLKIKQRMSIRVITRYYAKYRIRQYLRSRETIPAFPLEIWNTIFSFMDRIFSVPHRRLCREFSCHYPSRLPGPTCGICKNEAFIPVCLRFNWSGCYDRYENMDENMEENRLQLNSNMMISQKGKGFCAHVDNMYCLRCARDYIKQSQGTGRLICPYGCCNQIKPFPYSLYKAYGDWPRLPAAVPHYDLYHEMDRQGIGRTQCPLCSVDCGSTLAAIDHVRTVCRRS